MGVATFIKKMGESGVSRKKALGTALSLRGKKFDFELILDKHNGT